MRPRVVVFSFLLVSCMLCGVSAAFADTLKRVATTNYVDNRIATENGNMVIKNTSTVPVTLSNNVQTTAVTPASTQVATVGWADTNRTSKVRSGSATGTTLVDVWIE